MPLVPVSSSRTAESEDDILARSLSQVLYFGGGARALKEEATHTYTYMFL